MSYSELFFNTPSVRRGGHLPLGEVERMIDECFLGDI